MSNADSSMIAIADSYAEALLELTEASGSSDAVSVEMNALAEGMTSDADLADFMTSALIDLDARARTLENIFRGKMNDQLLDALLVINKNARAAVIPVWFERFGLLLKKLRGQVDVTVTSATALNKKQRASLVEALSKITGQQAVLSEEVDESLLGGLVVQVGDRKLDASVASKIGALRKELVERAAKEIHAGRSYVDAT